MLFFFCFLLLYKHLGVEGLWLDAISCLSSSNLIFSGFVTLGHLGLPYALKKCHKIIFTQLYILSHNYLK